MFWNDGIPSGGPAYKRHKNDNENNNDDINNNNDNNNNNSNSNVQEWWDPSRRSCLQKTWPSKAAIARSGKYAMNTVHIRHQSFVTIIITISKAAFTRSDKCSYSTSTSIIQ